MSERTLLVVALAALLAAAPAQGQAPVDASALRARVDSLADATARARAQLDSAREAAQRERRAQATAALDTQRIGPLRVVSTRASASTARAATERALEEFGAIGTDASSPLADVTLLVEHGETVVAYDELSERPGHVVTWLPMFTRSSRRSDAIAGALEGYLASRLPDDVRQWLGGGVSFRPDDDQLIGIYRLLVVVQAKAVEDCRAGDARACGAALGLIEPGPLWRNWYSADEVEAWLRERGANWLRGVEGPWDGRRRACFESSSVTDCDALIARGEGPGIPLSEHARMSLLAFALERGGATGYDSLTRDTSGTVLERLSRAAGTSPDELLAGWRARVMAARPAYAAGLGRSWVVTVIWTLVMSALAMRSTRWRLG